MKKLIVAFALLAISLSIFAEKTEEMYVMRHTTQGQLYFISEIIFPATDSKFSLPFDITYLNTSDSLSIKMTVPHHTLTNVDSVALVLQDDRYVCPMVKSIYKEKEKKHWIHRCDCAFTYEAAKKNFTQPATSPQVVVYTAAGTQTYAMPPKKWQALHQHLLEIFMLIDASKR
ncbi:MAG: hypothetical protein IIU55_02070 [Paludibacteraceae bacterium]|nr:hypothetical protein [Paludibacteraceae bacterium]